MAKKIDGTTPTVLVVVPKTVTTIPQRVVEYQIVDGRFEANTSPGVTQ